MAGETHTVTIVQISASQLGAGQALYGVSKEGRAYQYDFGRKQWIPLSDKAMSLADAGVAG